ncbi:bifunctional chorismate synthase/riboflavin reductase [NAD(P)H] aro2, partial [Kickxella alabastrina]
MSTFGKAFRVTTYGESHCKSVGCIIDGVPPGLALSEADIQVQLTRRRPGQSAITTPRNEKDRVTIQSGCEFGYTLGTPICLTVANQDQRPRDYTETDFYPRPSHADYTYLQKYGVKASSGGGRSSARETVARVAAGAVAEKYLGEAYGVEIVAFVTSVGPIEMPQVARGMGNEDFQALLAGITRAQVDANA